MICEIMLLEALDQNNPRIRDRNHRRCLLFSLSVFTSSLSQRSIVRIVKQEVERLRRICR
ncbi:hypothetical protein HanXRQr2_Chr12g0564901 [Helianthus annuus]|uniref:Uncharacterized protein n=1 Tax=Helianthus annuus TaxID=4232 RepID=A0A9K3MY17_HELAN|nr:hypothetical protein HanXRQr2_Chr12g0564901 [Helianthus annuus]KAJ0864630.1 hypothetical protein HanPSC8_Chr12g0544171 [Helianthus annuus]